MGYTGIGPATEPEPVQLPAGKEWKRTIIVNDDALSPVGQEQVDYRDAEIAKLRTEVATLESVLTSVKSDASFADKKLIESGREIARLRAEYAEHAYKDCDTEIAKLRAELDEARPRIAAIPAVIRTALLDPAVIEQAFKAAEHVFYNQPHQSNYLALRAAIEAAAPLIVVATAEAIAAEITAIATSPDCAGGIDYILGMEYGADIARGFVAGGGRDG